MKRNTIISIIKASGIILMVMGHAEVPNLLSNFIYVFHMPLFFIAAGYFFSRRNMDNPWEFCQRRIKGLYLPFLKWSIFFLLIHNLLFKVGLMNELYGNWTGGVTHPYTLNVFFKRLFMIVTSMSGYDEFMAGAFWFFRGLLVASILFLIFSKVIDRYTGLSLPKVALIVCGLALLINAYRFGFGVKFTTIPNGGLRDIWGLFFFGIGVVYRHLEQRIGDRYWLTALSLVVLGTGAWNHFCGMNNNGQMIDLLTLPLTGIAGWLVMHHLASIVDAREGRLRDMLIFIGDNTLYIFVFHIISFKVVSALKIMWYGLDWQQIGCHMVIHYNNHTDLFWVLYTIAGVGIPMLGLRLYHAIRESGFVRFGLKARNR